MNQKINKKNKFNCAICETTEHRNVCCKNSVKYVQCSKCNVVRQYPYPTQDEIDSFYENYQSHKSDSSCYLTDSGYEVFNRDKEFTFSDLGILKKDFKNKKVLDVGCATGQFVKMIEKYNLSKILGIDPSEECIKIAKKNGLPCEKKNFEAVNDEFDIITMWHVVEHLPFPQDFIKHSYDLLPQGGWLLIETPTIGIISEAFKENWRYYMPTEHINLFPTNSLIRLCLDLGFKLKNYVSFGSGNDNENIPFINKKAMDTIAKQLGFGDTLALWMIKS